MFHHHFVCFFCVSGNLNLDAGCRYNLYEASHATGCLQGSWIMMTGSSNTLLEFLVLFLFSAGFREQKTGFVCKATKNAQERRKFGRSSKKESCQVFQGRHHDLKMYFGGNGVKLPSKIYGANTRFCWHCPKQIKLKTNTSSSACALKGSWFWRFRKPLSRLYSARILITLVATNNRPFRYKNPCFIVAYLQQCHGFPGVVAEFGFATR